ncbi:hypothetical protein [Ralstonia solanacearum]|uniref:hypothetical protein n=1 Tax=Ralstonia solanacearum TaxID=305 RepID=UPI0018D12F71|nr:hypothetical protein [Ralstonia solanacearum]
MAKETQKERVLPQIVSKDGKAAQASATSNIWVGHGSVFSQPTSGNKIHPFTTGKDYFADFIAQCAQAKEEIYIIGWQVSWDAMLAPGMRLWDVLCEAAQRQVNIYVMPWDDTPPVQTYDDQTRVALEVINDHLGLSKKNKRVHVALAKSYATKNNSYFSHHQKLVVIDRKVAYVGGMDLCYGRYDDARFDLHADGDGRKVLNRYNPCVAWVQELQEEDPTLVDPDLLTGMIDSVKIPAVTKSNADEVAERIATRGTFQVPYAAQTVDATVADKTGYGRRLEWNGVQYRTLDPAKQPRMPWQDVHSRIEGPAVSDLLRNFVGRWNIVSDLKLKMPTLPSAYEKPGSAQIQVLRSAPAGMRKAEYQAAGGKLTGKTSFDTEDDIQRAMIQLIAKSQRFVYIESQFFVSAFGSAIPSSEEDLSPAAQYINGDGIGKATNKAKGASYLDSDSDWGWEGGIPRVKLDEAKLLHPPTNGVCAALIDRITRAVLDRAKPHYHVYITLPVHPEGSLVDASIAVQVYWTMQTLVFGSRSLLNGIRRALKAKELLEQKDTGFMRVIQEEGNREFESIPLEACFEYVTLLNLRNWTKLGDRYVTEQVYVHSKLTIVDDLYALLGSANVNDRSLLGERDSEIAVLVMDEDNWREDINGTGSQRPVRRFAHELRKQVWRKLFGLEGNVRPAKELEDVIRMPGKPESWRKLQARAQANAAAYEAAFKFVPRSWSPYRKNTPASIVPNLVPLLEDGGLDGVDAENQGHPAFPLPAEAAFWKEVRHDPAGVGQLEKVQGFITALPIHWTEGENNRFPYPSSLVTQNEMPSGAFGTSSALAAESLHKDDMAVAVEESEKKERA